MRFNPFLEAILESYNRLKSQLKEQYNGFKKVCHAEGTSPSEVYVVASLLIIWGMLSCAVNLTIRDLRVIPPMAVLYLAFVVKCYIVRHRRKSKQKGGEQDARRKS